MTEKLSRRESRIRAELDFLKPIWESSPKYGKGAALAAFDLCALNEVPFPRWLARAIGEELRRGASKQSLHFQRWREVRKMRDTRAPEPDWTKMRPGRVYPANEVPLREIGHDETFRWVEDRLRKTPAHGSANSIERSYYIIENDLPERLRYKPTYTKRSR